jgi:hypothetical protein
MDSLAYPIFQLVSSYIRNEYYDAMEIAYNNFKDYVGIIALAVESVYIIYYGFMVILEKATDSVPVPNFREFMYHCFTVLLILAIIRNNYMPLDFLLGLREMVITGLTSSVTAGGAQAENGLQFMDLAFSASNLVNSAFMEGAPDVKATAITLAIVAEVSPQITGGVMLLTNEIITSTGTALLPIVLYAFIYKSTSSIFNTWFNIMFASSIQTGVLAVAIPIAANVTGIFVGALSALVIATNLTSGAAGFYFSELQQSVIQAGFGITLTLLIVWLPSNAANFAGSIINAGMTKSQVGTPVSQRDVSQRTPRLR